MQTFTIAPAIAFVVLLLCTTTYAQNGAAPRKSSRQATDTNAPMMNIRASTQMEVTAEIPLPPDSAYAPATNASGALLTLGPAPTNANGSASNSANVLMDSPPKDTAPSTQGKPRSLGKKPASVLTPQQPDLKRPLLDIPPH